MNALATSRLAHWWIQSLNAATLSRPVGQERNTARGGRGRASVATRLSQAVQAWLERLARADEPQNAAELLAYARCIERDMPGLAADLRFAALRHADASQGHKEPRARGRRRSAPRPQGTGWTETCSEENQATRSSMSASLSGLAITAHDLVPARAAAVGAQLQAEVLRRLAGQMRRVQSDGQAQRAVAGRAGERLLPPAPRRRQPARRRGSGGDEQQPRPSWP